jgi:colanic acid/amylovoran biosynthesis glycosyltransferase
MKPRILYVVSRFPKLSETFVVNELSALMPRFDLRLAPLLRTHEASHDDVTGDLLRRAWFAPRFSLRTALAHVHWLRRAPHRYVGMWRALARDLPKGGLDEAAKTLAVAFNAARIAELAVGSDVEHVHAHFANHPATVAWVVHRLTGIPFSFTAHANDLFRAPPLVDRKAAEATFVIAISEYNRRLLLDRSPGAHVHVVHCGVDLARFAPGPTAPTTAAVRRHVVCVARFEPKKGHRDLLTAFAKIAADHPDLDLVLVGDGPYRPTMERLASSLAIAERVAFLGARSPAEVRELLTTADLFVLPALRDETGRMDGIPVALIEAMAAGVPVVTTSVSGIPELVGDDGGIMVAPSDPAAVSDAMARVLDDGILARRLAERGRERVVLGFDLSVEAAKLGDLFDASVAGGS